MAVKKHAIVSSNHSQMDLVALAQYIELMNNQNSYFLPHGSDLMTYCIDIVKCLALTSLPTEPEERASFSRQLLPIEEFLQRVSISLIGERRKEFIKIILEKFYVIISDPNSNASPALSIALCVLRNNSDAVISFVALGEYSKGISPTNTIALRASLNCLYRWMCEPTFTTYAADWVLEFVKSLEDSERFDILIEVSIDHIENLITLVTKQGQSLKQIVPLVLHVLSSIRYLPETIEKISSHVRHVLECLADDNREWSRQILQHFVDIFCDMMSEQHRLRENNTKALEAFREKYANVSLILESHMASSRSRYLRQEPWRRRTEHTMQLRDSGVNRKVGLTNLGNTCYMNSVMQALLLSQQFTNQTILYMCAEPYWDVLSQLFVKMIHSLTPIINPSDFFSVVKPPQFIKGQQHDCSEFFIRLMETLGQSGTKNKDEDLECPGGSRPDPSPSGSGNIGGSSPRQGTSSGSVSPPRVASSSRGPSSSGVNNALKRPTTLAGGPTQKKQKHAHDIIESNFTGVTITQITCTDCKKNTYSRDVFRDLHVSFPEKSVVNRYSVQLLLDYFCNPQMLSGENMYQCQYCGGLRDAECAVRFETSPAYLIMVLKNFKFDTKHMTQRKLFHDVDYNQTIYLPLADMIAEKTQYSLYAAVLHNGMSPDSGHYYTLGFADGQWFEYNDENVKQSSMKILNKNKEHSTPYMLFYRRCDVVEGPWPAINELPQSLQDIINAHNKVTDQSLRKFRKKLLVGNSDYN